jgi:hypothetical protein
MASCGPVPGIATAPASRCAAFNAEVERRIRRDRPRLVILASDWLRDSSANDFPGQLRDRLQALHDQELPLLLVGPPVTFHGTQPKAGLRTGSGEFATNAALPDLRRIDVSLRTVAEQVGVSYASPISELCRGDACRVFVRAEGRRQLIAWDRSHLTRGGSWFYANTFIAPHLAGSTR